MVAITWRPARLFGGGGVYIRIRNFSFPSASERKCGCLGLCLRQHFSRQHSPNNKMKGAVWTTKLTSRGVKPNPLRVVGGVWTTYQPCPGGNQQYKKMSGFNTITVIDEVGSREREWTHVCFGSRRSVRGRGSRVGPPLTCRVVPGRSRRGRTTAGGRGPGRRPRRRATGGAASGRWAAGAGARPTPQPGGTVVGGGRGGGGGDGSEALGRLSWHPRRRIARSRNKNGADNMRESQSPGSPATEPEMKRVERVF